MRVAPTPRSASLLRCAPCPPTHRPWRRSLLRWVTVFGQLSLTLLLRFDEAGHMASMLSQARGRTVDKEVSSAPREGTWTNHHPKDTTMYGFTTTIQGTTFDEALAHTLQALKEEGFGVLSDIDVQAAMKDKLGVGMPRYRILGACNPPLAHQALQAEPDIGLLLPCNVIVREVSSHEIVVGFLDPQVMVGLVGGAGVKAVADEAEQRLRRVCTQLGGHTASV